MAGGEDDSRLLRALAAATLVGVFVFMVVHTLRWPLMQDAQVLHYVNFLTGHGFAPYREIGDMNMPGAYWMERFGMTVFGAGDLGFRVYDIFLMVAMTGAMVAIAWPYDWLAGMFAGVPFAVIHAAHGSKGAGQRDAVMAVLMVSRPRLSTATRCAAGWRFGWRWEGSSSGWRRR